MGHILPKVLVLVKNAKIDFIKTFLQSGKKGYGKLLLLTYFLVWGGHWLLRKNGLLPKKSVEGNHIFITGAGSGIGELMAQKFAKLKSKVTIADINYDGALRVEQSIKKNGGLAKAVRCNVADPTSIKEAKDIAVKEFGEVDILINNAGIVSGKKMLEVEEKSIERTIQVNTISHGYTVKQFLPSMLERNKGHIVTIASMAGLVGVCGLTDYCASKYGAVGFDEALRMELRKLKSNVKTTCICPYFINTGMFDGAKTKLGILMPILTAEYAAQRIVNAVLQDEATVIMPSLCNLTYFVRALLPTSWFDYTQELFGISEAMDDFKGRPVKA